MCCLYFIPNERYFEVLIMFGGLNYGGITPLLEVGSCRIFSVFKFVRCVSYIMVIIGRECFTGYYWQNLVYNYGYVVWLRVDI
jgi:hypothetical protein